MDTKHESPTPSLPPRPASTSTAATDAAAEARPARKRRIWAIGVAAALALAAAGGAWAWHAETARRLAQAQEACQAAHTDATAARDALTAYLKSDTAATAAKTGRDQVKDPKAVDALAAAIEDAKAADPAIPACEGGRADLDTAVTTLRSTAGTLDADLSGLKEHVKAVADSQVDKQVDDATALWKSSDGKVADGKVRDRLKAAIDRRDTAAIADARKAVDDSIKAKADADAKAKAEQEAQAAAQAAAEQAAAQAQAQAQQQTQAQQSYGYGSTGYGYSGGGYTPTYDPGYTPSTGGGNSGSGSDGSSGGGSFGGSWGCGDNCPTTPSDGHGCNPITGVCGIG